MKNLKYDNGDEMPILGLGTWQSASGEVHDAVKEALKVGYRHIDCARIYGNEQEIGRALAESFNSGVVVREDVWITSKLWNDSHAPKDVRPAVEQSLADLGLDYLDLYLMHWPLALAKGRAYAKGPEHFVSLKEVPLAETWAAMEALVDAGLCRHIGVSNFSNKTLGALIDSSKRKPEVNQVELHPYLQQTGLLEFCHDNGVHVTAYSPLGSPDRPRGMKAEDEPVILAEPVIANIAVKHGVSPGQVLIAWAIARGTSVIPKSTNPGRIGQNLAAANIELDDDDMANIASLDRQRRYVDGSFWVVEGGPYTLEGLWGE